MHKVLKLILLIFFYSFPVSLIAQNKYAVLLAVNDYYENPGVKSRHSLQGCVNDANAIKGLLVNRFGFNTSNVNTLYNAAATKKNLIDLMYTVLQKCRPGDAVVFFYSGHGVWMTNHMLDKDLVKRGMSQAIVMNDLYSPGWDCLVKDEVLKNMFNQFVDKKIILTTIFDCCFSANMMMKPHGRYWNPLAFQQKDTKKDLDFKELPYVPREEKPKGCRVDSLGNLLDTADTDRDGVPDCRDWEINSIAGNVDSLGVVDDPDPYQFIDQADNYYDPAKFAGNSAKQDESQTDKSFNLSAALTASNKSSVRPSERKNSQFLSLAGTADNQKGLEITDISAIRHGAFTAALMHVYRSNPSTLPVSDLMKKITAVMQQQSYHQTPSFHFDPARLKSNLIGINPTGFSNRLKAVCTSNKHGIVTIDKGLSDGVAKGNIFSDINLAGKQKVQILNVTDNNATAFDKTKGQVKQGHVLEMTDDYIVSDPFLKIFIPTTKFTPASFQVFFKNKITPLVNRTNYGDYDLSDDMQGNSLITWNGANKIQQTNYLNPNPEKNLLYVLLPVPSYIADPLKSIIAKDQNIEIADDPSKAAYGVYLNYVKQRADTKSRFIFYIHPIINGRINTGADIFSDIHVEVPTLDLKNVQVITNQLYDQAKKLIRFKTRAWLNTYPKR